MSVSFVAYTSDYGIIVCRDYRLETAVIASGAVVAVDTTAEDV